MSEIRILEAITPSRIGGAEVFVAELCAQLPDYGAPHRRSERPCRHSERSEESRRCAGDSSQAQNDTSIQVELWCPAGRPFVEYAAQKGIEPITWRTFGKLDPRTVIRLARLMRARGIDVIHTHLSTASLLGAFAARLARRPSVAHVHGLNTATCFRYSSRIIAVSDAVKRHLTAQGIRQDRIRVVHNGVDLDTFEPENDGGGSLAPCGRSVAAKLRLGYDPDAPLFGVFGRLSPEKGQRVAIEALFLVLKDLPEARLVLAGQGAEWESLQTFANALGVAENVQFAGFVHNVRHLMSACDAVIVPSLREGFGLSAVEAMALERPVVASATGGLTEIVVQGETGFLVPQDDPNALAQALIRLASDGSLRDLLGTNARKRAEQCFDLRKQIGLVLAILLEVL